MKGTQGCSHADNGRKKGRIIQRERTASAKVLRQKWCAWCISEADGSTVSKGRVLGGEIRGIVRQGYLGPF